MSLDHVLLNVDGMIHETLYVYNMYNEFSSCSALFRTPDHILGGAAAADIGCQRSETAQQTVCKRERRGK